MNRRLLYHMFAALCAIIWGTTFLVSKMLLEAYSPIQIIIMRFILAYIALWIICPKWEFKLKKEAGFLLMSLFGNTLYYIAENTALIYTYSSNVSILVSAAPVTTAILMIIFYGGKKKISSRQMAGILVAFAGMSLVVLNGSMVLKLSPLGDVLSLCGALSWGFYSIILEKYTEEYSSMFISRKIMFYGILTSLPMLIYQGDPFPIGKILQLPYLLGILFLGLIGSAFCYIAWNTACAGMGVVKANMYIYTIPFVTLIAGRIFMGEPITIMAVLGAVIITIGMMISSKKNMENES